MMEHSYAVLVPVYNEKSKIEQVIKRLQASDNPHIVVVDDGSTDGSGSLASELGAHVITLEATLGVGRALVRGMRYVASQGYKYCVIMAGNNKDEPKEIPKLLEPIIEDRADFVQGSRWLDGGGVGGDMPFYRIWGTKFHPLIFSWLVGKKITESTNGFRAFRCSLLGDQRIDLDQSWLDGYEMEPYFLYKVISLNYRHMEVACTKIYPPKKLGITKMRPIIDWWHLIKPIFWLRLGLRR